MTMQRFVTTSYDGKTSLAAYKLIPKAPRGMVQISHGMAEYFLRYRPFAEFLVEAGMVVFGHDHLGHGYSAKSSKDLGFTVRNGGTEALIEDVHNLTLKMKQEYPNLPVVLFGHSMGSFIARAVTAKYAASYAGAVFCGTCGYGMPAALGKALTCCMMTFLGEHYRSKLLKKIAFGGYNKTFGKGCDPNAWLSRDEAVVNAYNADELCGFNFTVRGYHDLFELIEQISHKDWATRLSRDLPVLVTAGEADPVGNYGQGPKEVAEKLLAANMRDVTLKLYPEMRHEILNETERERVWTDLLEWLEQRLG